MHPIHWKQINDDVDDDEDDVGREWGDEAGKQKRYDLHTKSKVYRMLDVGTVIPYNC